ncbi:MAG: hypothetical protein ACTSO9_03215 [Candidatus Helarchaeota archaeon]
MQESKDITEWNIIKGKRENLPLSYKELNSLIRQSVRNDHKFIKLVDICGQRFIGAGLECSKEHSIELEIHGVPGNDLGIFMDGPKITVKGNAEDQVGNTMNNGTIIIEGDCRDVAGLSMRGGKIFVKGNAGYRIGIHMKEYQNKIPIIIIGGAFKEFFGEYMAGGILISLGLDTKNSKVCNLENFISPNLASGIHGGKIIIRGEVPDSYLGIGAFKRELIEEDYKILKPIINEYCSVFGLDQDFVWDKKFCKIVPGSHRPYAAYYTAKPI